MLTTKTEEVEKKNQIESEWEEKLLAKNQRISKLEAEIA